MKNKFLMKLLVAGYSIALLLTGCGKENNETNTLINTTVETPTETVTEEAEETVEEEVEKEAAPETEEPKEETSEETTDNKEEEPENEDEVSGEESSTLDEETEESNTQNDSSSSQTSNSTGNGNSGNSSNNSNSSGSNNSSGNSNTGSSGSSTTGNTSTGNNTTAPHTHTYDAGAITKYANCTTTGIKTYTCSCGNTYTETIPATAHTYSNGSCTVCGTADPNYVAAYTYDVYLETGMLSLVNARRNSLGYSSLAWDSSMDETAKIRARQLADWFGHTGEAGGTELITGGGGSIGLSSLHNNYINSSGHDNELHRNNYANFSSATCVVKDSNGNITATYNVIILRSAQSEGASSQNMQNSGIIDPNPPSDDDIIW